MSADQSTKLQALLWWITSIAISVLCCSILFVLFASYLVDIKADIRDTEARLHMIEDRESVLLTELQAIHKQVMPPVAPPAPPVGPAASDATTPATTPPSDVPPVTPPAASPSAPAEVVPTSPPAINVPSVPAAPTPPAK